MSNRFFFFKPGKIVIFASCTVPSSLDFCQCLAPRTVLPTRGIVNTTFKTVPSWLFSLREVQGLLLFAFEALLSTEQIWFKVSDTVNFLFTNIWIEVHFNQVSKYQCNKGTMDVILSNPPFKVSCQIHKGTT